VKREAHTTCYILHATTIAAALSLSGRMGRAKEGGAPGDSGDVYGCLFPATAGSAWHGGDGAQFGGGGGG
jgi:hypothetical protein